MTRNLDEAIRSFDLTPSHRTIYDPNELIAKGFPGEFLLPLINSFESGDWYKYHSGGEIVDELIGISHGTLVSAIAKHLGVPDDVGSGYTGRGFAMQAEIEAIRKILRDDQKDD
jgi:hypothetical protein